MANARIELTKLEWVEAQELALSLEGLIDGEEGDPLADQLVPVRDFLVKLANKVILPLPAGWRDSDEG